MHAPGVADGGLLPLDYDLPSMSMDSFMAAIDDQDTLTRLRAGQGDEYADRFLPSWDELANHGVAQGDWLASSRAHNSS